MPRHRAVGRRGRPLADQQFRRDEVRASSATARPRHAQRPARAQTRRQLTAQRAASLHIQRLVDGLVADTHRFIFREVAREAPSNLLRAPRTSPPPRLSPPVPTSLPCHHRPRNHRAAWRHDHASQPLLHVLAQLSMDRELRRLGPARGAIRMPLGRRRSVLEAAGTRAALRRSSREIVDGARATRRAISRTPCPWARQSAICSRSVNARYRPDSGGAEGMRCDAGMPPASRNHRVPTAGDTPALTAASSLECPVAIAAQNRRCSSRRRTEGRPGERSFARPARSDRLLRVVIATPFGAVVRRPVELRCLRLERVYSLRHDMSRVSSLNCHRKCAAFNTRDIDEVSDKAVHPSSRPLNTLSMHEHLLGGILPRDFRGDQGRGSDHRMQHIPQVVAHGAQKLIPRRDQIVGPSAFIEKVLVCVVASDGKKVRALSAFFPKEFVGVISLLSDRLVFQHSFPL
jgi:hypothetical protein